MGKEYGYTVKAPDEASKKLIEDAFAKMYVMPMEEKREESKVPGEEPKITQVPKFTSEQFVEYHMKNYVKGVVTEYEELLARQAAKKPGSSLDL